LQHNHYTIDLPASPTYVLLLQLGLGLYLVENCLPARQSFSITCASDDPIIIERLQRETVDIHPPGLLSNSSDLSPIDCPIWNAMQDRVYQTPVGDVFDLRQRLIDAHRGRCRWWMASETSSLCGRNRTFWTYAV